MLRLMKLLPPWPVVMQAIQRCGIVHHTEHVDIAFWSLRERTDKIYS